MSLTNDSFLMETEMSNKTIQSNSSNPRRSFIKKGALGAALVTTISSKSAWAGACTVSGALSGNLSNNQLQTSCDLKGYSHGSWKHPDGNGKNRWDFVMQYYDFTPTSTIATLFSGHTLSSALGDLAGDTIMEALEPRGTAKGLAKQQITAALNAYLFAAMKTAYLNDSTVDFSSIVDADFYYDKKNTDDLTVADALATTLDWILDQDSETILQGGSRWSHWY
jgi:hypothetical protein